MAYCPPTSPVYTPHIAALALTGRVINCTVPDGNCLFRSFSKGLLGTERFHYSIRSVLVSFIIRNALYFDEHSKARNQTSPTVSKWVNKANGVQTLRYLQWPLYSKFQCMHTPCIINQRSSTTGSGTSPSIQQSLILATAVLWKGLCTWPNLPTTILNCYIWKVPLWPDSFRSGRNTTRTTIGEKYMLVMN